MNNFYAVIMAGGLGGRLWPLSRRAKPKQLHTLISDESMIRETFLRLLPKFGAEKIIISTTPDFAKEIKKHLPEVPDKNYIVEPFLMGNAAACGLVTKILNVRDPKSSAIFLPADAHIKDKRRFLEVISYAEKLLQKHPDHIIQIGIKPTKPDTGLGYIQVGNKIESDKNVEALSVKRFVEKPTLETAEKYLQSGEYLWNAGIFAWHTSSMLSLIEKHMPKLFKGLNKIGEALGRKDEDKVIEEEYGRVEKTTIDYGIIEKTNKLLVIPADFGWSDVGSWETLHQVLSELHQEKNISRGHHIGFESENCLVLSNTKKLIATIGLKDIAIIDTPDAILICQKSQSHRVKELLEQIDEKYL